MLGRYGPDEFLLIADVGRRRSRAARPRLRTALVDLSLHFDETERLPDHRQRRRGLLPRARGLRDRAAVDRAARSPRAPRRAAATRSDRRGPATTDAQPRPRRSTSCRASSSRSTPRTATPSATPRMSRATPTFLGAADRDADGEICAPSASPACSTTWARSACPTRSCASPASSPTASTAILQQHVALGDMIVRDLPDVESVRAGDPASPRALGRQRLPPSTRGRGHPAHRPHPGRRRRLLGDDHDPAVPQGARHRGGADQARRRGRHASSTSGWSRRSSRASSRTRSAPLPGDTARSGDLWVPDRHVA